MQLPVVTVLSTRLQLMLKSQN